jgi:hypothetical protein
MGRLGGLSDLSVRGLYSARGIIDGTLDDLGGPVLLQRGIDLVDGSVSIKGRVERQQSAADGGKVGSSVRLSSPSLLHRVDEASGFRVTEISKGCNVESSHHINVLMNQVVAVEHVNTIPRGVSSKNPNNLIGTKEDNILHSDLLVRLNTTSGTGNNLEINQVDMDRVSPSTGRVLKLPKLGGSTLRVGEDTIGDIRKSNSVDTPLSIGTLKLEVLVDGSLHFRKGLGTENRRNGAVIVVVGNNFSNDESHNSVGTSKVLVGHNITGVLHSNILSSVSREVDNNLITLSYRDVHVVDGNRLANESRVGCNDGHGNDSSGTVEFKVDTERTGDSSVEKAETVFAGLDLKERPGLTVDLDDVSVQRVVFSRRRIEVSVGLVTLGGKHQGNIVLSGGKVVFGLFNRVAENVETGLTVVGVDCGDVHSMVVVPHGTSLLAVREVVVLELTGGDGILSPSIEGSTRVGSVKVDGGVLVILVDETDKSYYPVNRLEIHKASLSL